MESKGPYKHKEPNYRGPNYGIEFTQPMIDMLRELSVQGMPSHKMAGVISKEFGLDPPPTTQQIWYRRSKYGCTVKDLKAKELGYREPQKETKKTIANTSKEDIDAFYNRPGQIRCKVRYEILLKECFDLQMKIRKKNQKEYERTCAFCTYGVFNTPLAKYIKPVSGAIRGSVEKGSRK